MSWLNLDEITIDRTGVSGTVNVFDADGDVRFVILREELDDDGIRTAIRIANKAYEAGLRVGKSRTQRDILNALGGVHVEDFTGPSK